MQKAIVTVVQKSFFPEPVVRSSCTDAITSNEQYIAMNPSADISRDSSILGQQTSVLLIMLVRIFPMDYLCWHKR